MKFADFLAHLFLPRHTNNHRSRALHHSALTFYIALILVFNIAVSVVNRFNPEILGYATNISIRALLDETNKQRVDAGAGEVQLDEKLSEAARKKAADMFTNQYWAHNSPKGKDPWSFISAAGYRFLFAGENLARDFNDSKAVVEAWMKSPSHRDNLINPRYKDIGFAVADGKYGSYETTLVVQMFGTKAQSDSTISPSAASVSTKGETDSDFGQATPSGIAPEQTPTNPDNTNPAGMILRTNSENQDIPKVDFRSITKTGSMVLVGLLVIILIIDGIVSYHRRTIRMTGHNFAHMVFLLAVLLALGLLGRIGLIL